MALKSAIARPRIREFIPAGETYRVFVAAWGSNTVVEQVELSADDGKTWKPVTFLDEPHPFVWRRWKFDWQVPSEKGTYTLKSRATDAEGNAQPEHHDKRFGSYVIHHTLGIEVVVRQCFGTSSRISRHSCRCAAIFASYYRLRVIRPRTTKVVLR
jgi:hypothetical protein